MNWYKSIKPLEVSLKRLKQRCQEEGIKMERGNKRVEEIIKELKEEQAQAKKGGNETMGKKISYEAKINSRELTEFGEQRKDQEDTNDDKD